MPSKTESEYASYMLAHLAHCAPGARIYTGANAGECVKDGEVLAQPSTYPAWYSRLCEKGEKGGAIRVNLELMSRSLENTRRGHPTQGYTRVLKEVRNVMLYGCPDSATPPDFAYMRACGVDEESILSAMDYYGCLADDNPTPAPVRELYADLPPAMRSAMPHLEPYADAVLGVGNVLWVKAADKVAAQALAKAGFKFAPTLGAWHNKIEAAGRLPVVSAPQAPRRVAWREYSREPIRL